MTSAEQIFKTAYLPHIKEHVMQKTHKSYVCANNIPDIWCDMVEYNRDTAEYLAFHAKSFFSLTFAPDSEVASNPELIQELIELIIANMMPYLKQNPGFARNEHAARLWLNKRLIRHNAFLCRAIHRREIATQKRPRIKIERAMDEFNNAKRVMLVDIEKEAKRIK